jgi:hypothetical protein
MINVRKSVIFVPKGVFLGFVILAAKIKADINKIAAIRDKPQPSTATKMRAFVNAAGYFRHLIKNYAYLFSPLTDLTGGPKNQAVTLSSEAKAAWEKIRDAIIILPVVKSFNWTLPVIIETDFSQRFVGAMLLQPHFYGAKRVLHPVAYYNKKLTDTQSRYFS